MLAGGSGDVCEGGVGGGDGEEVHIAVVSDFRLVQGDFLVLPVGEGGTNTVVGIVLLVDGRDWVGGSGGGVHVGLLLALQPVLLLSFLRRVGTGRSWGGG